MEKFDRQARAKLKRIMRALRKRSNLKTQTLFLLQKAVEWCQETKGCSTLEAEYKMQSVDKELTMQSYEYRQHREMLTDKILSIDFPRHRVPRVLYHLKVFPQNNDSAVDDNPADLYLFTGLDRELLSIRTLLHGTSQASNILAQDIERLSDSSLNANIVMHRSLTVSSFLEIQMICQKYLQSFSPQCIQLYQIKSAHHYKIPQSSATKEEPIPSLFYCNAVAPENITMIPTESIHLSIGSPQPSPLYPEILGNLKEGKEAWQAS